ncbi:RDD family protein [bacterium]|nr:RDD family protein [bacterium]
MQQAPNPQMAGFLERFLASFIDGIIVMVGFYIVMIPLALIGGGMSTLMLPADNSGTDALGIFMMLVIYLIAMVMPLLYYIYFYTKNGQTLGKKILNIKVVRPADNSYLSWGRVLLRETVGKLLSSFFFGLGYFWYFSSAERQAWHDSISDSIVVKTDSTGKILLDGPDLYPQEYVKTFLPCGCITLFYAALIFAIVMFGIAASGSESATKKAIQKSNTTEYVDKYDIAPKTPSVLDPTETK